MDNDIEIANAHQSEAWNGYEGRHWADNRDRYDTMISGLNAPLFDAAGIGAADRVLDVGCGAGASTRIAARRAERGRAVGIDLSAPMLERARRAATAEGLDNVEFGRGDAQVYPFPAGHFDVAISRGGIMYFDDPDAAFANIARALRPGGRLAFVCGGGDGEDETVALWGALAQHVPLPDPAEDDAPGPATFTDPGKITAILEGAGFSDVATAGVVTESVFGGDAADATDFIFGWGPIVHWLRDSSEEAVTRARAAVTDALRPFESDGAGRMRGPALQVSATRP